MHRPGRKGVGRVKRGRPRKIRMKKSFSRRVLGRGKKGIATPRQKAATVGRNRTRRARGK